jgi:hypothetical protein
MSEARPDVFLCHNRADKDWVRELGTRLEAETIDATKEGRRIRVFFDEWDIEKGENIVSRLGEELASGAFVAAVMSPEFFGSDWTRFEWTDIVARDPANNSGRLLPLRLRDVSFDGAVRLTLRAPFNALRHFDFRSKAYFETEFEDLLRRIRNQPLPRGRAATPRYSSAANQSSPHSVSIETAEPVPEILLSNLFPLATSPPPLYMAVAAVSSLSDVPSEPGFDALTLKIWDGKVVTFSDLEDPECLLNRVIDPHTIERLEFQRCIETPDLVNQWLSLANKNLARALRDKGIAPDEKGRFYFLRDPKRDIRLVKVGSSKPRAVAAKKKHHTSGEAFWVHYSANIRFRVIGTVPFLRILPSYAFTRDGVVALDHKQSGRFRVIWGGRQDSATVLRQLLFWLRFLADGHEEWTLETGGPPLRISVFPATTETQVGIALDHIQIKALMEDSSEDELTNVVDTAEFGAPEEEEVNDEDKSSEDEEREP